jgi:hypothetical protein
MLIDRACFERGCACYDSRDGEEAVEVVRKGWVELTDAEIKSARDFVGFSYEIGEELHYFARHLETKLKEKNS